MNNQKTVLEGKTKETIIRENISCSCRDVYKEKEMPDPHCFYHEHLYKVEEMMDSWASQRAVAFAEWLQESRWFNFERNEGLWYYTFEQGTAMSEKTYNKNYRKTTPELYALFIKDTENKAQ